MAATTAPNRLHVVSWNVASWTTTLKEIRAQHGSFKAWADKHQVEILCLQEVKSNLGRLEKEPPAFAAQEPGFEAFFSLCRTQGGSGNGTSSASSKVGFNGVATFARKGSTLSANASPLGIPDLDNQGRCLETDHGDFLLFNIYAPYDGWNGDSLDLKMRFLIAVREAMRKRRAETGKPVILAGDFNARYRLLDSSREMRTLDIGKLRRTPPLPNEPAIVSQLRRVLTEERLEKVKASLSKLELQPFGDKGKFRVFARHPETNELKRINPETTWSKEHADSYRPFDGQIVPSSMTVRQTSGFADLVHSSGYPVAEITELDDVRWTAYLQDSIMLSDLRVITRELLDVTWTDESFNAFADYEKGGWLLAGKLCTTGWMECLLGEDGMVDTFAHVNPSAKGRYTVWCQQTNDRFTNLGSRIDYILVDSIIGTLRLAPNPIPLYGCKCHSLEQCKSAWYKCADSEECALNACTAYGRWRPAPFSGGGLPQGTAADYETQFRQAPHTGIIYTPPQFSDHVATSCVLEGISDNLAKRGLQLSKDSQTSVTRPFAKQSSISSFFTVSNKRQKSGDVS